MWEPKKVKYRKQQRRPRRNKGKAWRGGSLAFGSFGLQALDRTNITSRQLEATRRVISRYLKKEGKLWIRIFPDKAITSKGVEVSMGAGKGDVIGYVASVKKGRILFELDGISKQVAKEAFRLAAYKLPLKTRFVERK